MQDAPIATTTDSAKLIGIVEAARRLAVSSDTIRRRIKDGTLPAVMFAGRYRIRTEDVDALVEPESRAIA